MDARNKHNSVESVVHEYTPRLRQYIHRRLNNSQDTEDVLQDVFYQLMRTTSGDMSMIERMPAWIFRVAHNAIINLTRKKREEEWHVYADDAGYSACEELSEALFSNDNPTPDIVYLRSIVWDELDMALAELPPGQREVFELNVFEGMPMKDIAAATGVSLPTLLSRKHYAVKFLRARLGEIYNDIINTD